jgi:hypothetical protein
MSPIRQAIFNSVSLGEIQRLFELQHRHRWLIPQSMPAIRQP